MHGVLKDQWKPVNVVSTFTYIIISARFQCSNCSFLVARTSNDHYGQRQILLSNVAQQRKPVADPEGECPKNTRSYDFFGCFSLSRAWPFVATLFDLPGAARLR